jgi:guanidinobutyrase
VQSRRAGDHTVTLPILRAIAKKHGPVGLLQVDAHADANDRMFGAPVAHGTPFRRALEEGLIEGRRVVQIGLRGHGYGPQEAEWTRAHGFRSVPAEQCWHRSLVPLMDEVRVQLEGGPVYVTFDIDALDPAFAPGTGTPEGGGRTVAQGIEVLRGCRGLDIVGGDLVEVAPSWDPTTITALAGANLLYELLCVLPGVRYDERRG